MTPDDAPTLRDWLGPGEASVLDEADLADLEVAVEAVLAGGREVLRRYRTGGEVEREEKAPGDPVTEADRAADRAIARVLRRRRPGEAIRSEESEDVPAAAGARKTGPGGAVGGPAGGAGHPSGHLWIVDPLDGTKEFLARNGEFAVMVGLAVEGAARLGAVYRPDPGVLYLGSAAGGAWAGELREDRGAAGGGPGSARSGGSRAGGSRAGGSGAGGAGPSSPAPSSNEIEEGRGREGSGGEGPGEGGPADDGDSAPEVRSLADFRDPVALRVSDAREGPVRLLHSRSHRPEGLERLSGVLGQVELVPLGSAGLKCSGVAAGTGDLYVHPVPYMMEWDTCAPEAVLRGAGGRVADCLGETLRYGKDDPAQPEGIFAGRPPMWEEVREVVRDLAP